MNAVDPEAGRAQDLEGLIAALERLESIFAGWDEGQRSVVEAWRRATDALNKEALTRLIRILKSQPATHEAIRTAACDEVVYAVLRHHGVLKPSLNERIEVALNSVRPILAAHGGDIELVKVDPPRIAVRFSGACDGCAASALTFQAGVRKAVQDACPEITEILQVKHPGAVDKSLRFASPFGLNAGGAWLYACALSDISEGRILAIGIGGQEVVLYRRGAAVTCFQDACAHLGSPVREGSLEDGIITCPHHGFRYELASGLCLTAPDVQLRAHAVRVIANRVEVRLAQ